MSNRVISIEVAENCIISINPEILEGKGRELLHNAIESINELNLWSWVKNYEYSGENEDEIESNEHEKNMELISKRANGMHSGFSMDWTMDILNKLINVLDDRQSFN